MTTQTIFNVNFTLDTTADVTIDVSGGHSYSNTSGANPWHMDILVDGSENNGRGGSTAVSDVVSVMGAAGSLAAGSHNVTVTWFGSSSITLVNSVLRILITKR